jgi:hypothetical protein
MRVVSGSSGMVELSNFIQEYQSLAVDFTEKDLESDWFSMNRE